MVDDRRTAPCLEETYKNTHEEESRLQGWVDEDPRQRKSHRKRLALVLDDNEDWCARSPQHT